MYFLSGCFSQFLSFPVLLLQFLILQPFLLLFEWWKWSSFKFPAIIRFLRLHVSGCRHCHVADLFNGGRIRFNMTSSKMQHNWCKQNWKHASPGAWPDYVLQLLPLSSRLWRQSVALCTLFTLPEKNIRKWPLKVVSFLMGLLQTLRVS